MISGRSKTGTQKCRIQAGRAVKLTHTPKFTYNDVVKIVDGPSISEREYALRSLFVGPFVLDNKLLHGIASVLAEQHFKFDSSIVKFKLTSAVSYYGSTNVVLDTYKTPLFVMSLSKINCKDFICTAATVAHELIHVEINLRCREPDEWNLSHGIEFVKRKEEFEALYPFLGDLVKL